MKTYRIIYYLELGKKMKYEQLLDEVKEVRKGRTLKFKKQQRLALHRTVEGYTEEENKKYLINASFDQSCSIAAGSLLRKKRTKVSESNGDIDMVNEFMEMMLISRAMVKEDCQIYLQDLIDEYHLFERKKTFKDITVELSFSSEKNIWEGAGGKAVLAGLFLKMRSKLKAATNDADKFKAIADMIALAAMFNYDTVQTVFKQIGKEQEEE